jgi:hypothetical protein
LHLRYEAICRTQKCRRACVVDSVGFFNGKPVPVVVRYSVEWGFNPAPQTTQKSRQYGYPPHSLLLPVNNGSWGNIFGARLVPPQQLMDFSGFLRQPEFQPLKQPTQPKSKYPTTPTLKYRLQATKHHVAACSCQFCSAVNYGVHAFGFCHARGAAHSANRF